MKYFTLKELTHSDTAVSLGIKNEPNAAQVRNLEHLVKADVQKPLQNVIRIIEIIELGNKGRRRQRNLVFVSAYFVKRIANAFFGVVGAVPDALAAVNATLGIDNGTAVPHSDCLCGTMFHAGCAACAF